MTEAVVRGLRRREGRGKRDKLHGGGGLCGGVAVFPGKEFQAVLLQSQGITHDHPVNLEVISYSIFFHFQIV